MNLDAVAAEARQGMPGSATLRLALARHRPELALTRSVLEERFLALCEEHGIPAPKVNAVVCGMTVDACGSNGGSSSSSTGTRRTPLRARVERDRRRELRLRAARYIVVRYTLAADHGAAQDSGGGPLVGAGS